ncbi:hypothetical protein MgSA37_00747 [Mucilaginibacter gotjawali]|uniref:Uncharacterized protein n=2 Tax=Mucilaginibacter gotjawali TaxID=1550579 RepID=A0A839SKF7_9SPHI|nr:hypothetical protein [Mucilaginibacter gotjawali]BAU52585.1 hypothetical protein MgSA37_00747 [Mucilaginibacter gotjawali]
MASLEATLRPLSKPDGAILSLRLEATKRLPLQCILLKLNGSKPVVFKNKNLPHPKIIQN